MTLGGVSGKNENFVTFFGFFEHFKILEKYEL